MSGDDARYIRFLSDRVYVLERVVGALLLKEGLTEGRIKEWMDAAQGGYPAGSNLVRATDYLVQEAELLPKRMREPR